MRQSGCTALVTAAVMALGVSVSAQKTTPVHPGKGGSPHVKTAWVIDGANITIEYGQPQLKGRAEAAADAAGTALAHRRGRSHRARDRQGAEVRDLQPARRHLHDQHPARREGWQLIFGKLSKPGQWGVPYQKDLEIGRTPMAVGKTKAPVDSMTIYIDDTPQGRNAARRMGRHQRDRAIHGGIGQSLVGRQSLVASHSLKAGTRD